MGKDCLYPDNAVKNRQRKGTVIEDLLISVLIVLNSKYKITTDWEFDPSFMLQHEICIVRIEIRVERDAPLKVCSNAEFQEGKRRKHDSVGTFMILWKLNLCLIYSQSSLSHTTRYLLGYLLFPPLPVDHSTSALLPSSETCSFKNQTFSLLI